MCDVCSDFLQLLISYETRVSSDEAEHPTLRKNEVEIALGYIHTWPQRQCMCCYRDLKNFERFNLVVQSLICLTVCQLKDIGTRIEPSEQPKKETDTKKTENDAEDIWTVLETEKLLILLSKIFLLNFPLYVAYKHGVHSRLEEVSQQELATLNTFCDLNDTEIPTFLLRNVSLFCKSGGVNAMTECFELKNLPVSTAHAITAAVCNLKLWLNYRSIVQLFVPLRSKVLKYMCRLSDQDLRSPATRTMADFMWAAVKDPLDTHLNFDCEGLELAFKYFSSTTLTMRLSGISQINAHINLFNDICSSETISEAETVGQKLADWLTENNIIGCIFGPNLHVEIIKQSHIILNFLAVEGRISEEHIDLIWQAAQLKHCSKPVNDLLPALVKNLSSRPALHLYSLLCRLETREHTEQSLYIASALIKFIWSRGGAVSGGGNIPCPSSSENSVSIEASNSEEEQAEEDSSIHSVGPKSTSETEGIGIEGKRIVIKMKDTDIEDIEGPPCKQPRPRATCSIDNSNNNIPGSNKLDIDDSNETGTEAKLEVCNASPIEHDNPDFDLMVTSSEEGSPLAIDICRKKVLRRRKKAKVPKSTIGGIMENILSDGESQSGGEGEGLLAAIRNPLADSHAAISRLTQMNSAAESRGFMAEIGANSLSHSHLLDLLSGEEEEGSYSSPMSNKSEKNMADFDGEDSPCEEELAQLAARVNPNCAYQAGCLPAFTITRGRACAPRELPTGPPFKVNDVCQPGNTLLWDLLQDDKIGQLGMGLALEAEKALCTLLCFSTEKYIRMKFIEGCLQNLANNWSVVISLRLLPKLLASFQQFRAMDTHNVTLWAERQHRMLHHFFSNLNHYIEHKDSLQALYAHPVQVQVRLQFLTAVFSAMGSPDHFRLSLSQVDSLWDWLSNDPQCSDCLFSWLQCQCQGGDQHALGVTALKHLYLTKLPMLQPENISMVALGLFQQLCSLARIAAAHMENHTEGESQNESNDIVGMSYLWKIALKANNTDVSMAAIQYLNSYYMGRQLRMEKEFVSQCMTHLSQAEEELKPSGAESSNENALLSIQRALLLLNTHLETFRRRYAYHLRRWALEGRGVGSHVPWGDRAGTGAPIKIILQPGGLKEKATLHMLGSDYVADLRAEIAKWWEGLQVNLQARSVGGAPVLGSLLSEGPLRIITQGQEICTEHDERTLQDVGFKDNQMVYVSLGMGPRAGRRRETSDCPSLLPPPPREFLPTLLLLQPNYLEQLFRLMATMGDMKTSGKGGNVIPHTKAQLLSRRVWDILTLLPTSPVLLEGFQNISKEGVNTLHDLLNPCSPQKLMYSLYIVESLCRQQQINKANIKNVKKKAIKIIEQTDDIKKNEHSEKVTEIVSSDEDKATIVLRSESNPCNMSSSCDYKKTELSEKSSTEHMETDKVEENNEPLWTDLFIQHGGLRHLFDIFMSGVLQKESGDDSEWRHDCLGTLLKLLCHLGLEGSTVLSQESEAILHVPKLSQTMLSMMTVGETMLRLTSILTEASIPRDPLHYKTGFWGRGQVVHYAMSILVSWIHCCEAARSVLWNPPGPSEWLQRLILDDPEPLVRRETCAAMYRLCLGNGRLVSEMTGPMLGQLIGFLSKAESMRPQKENLGAPGEEGKEPYGPACGDYFWLLCRLVDSIPAPLAKESFDDPIGCSVDLEGLAVRVAASIRSRDFLEVRYGGAPDEGLVGLLNLMTTILKHDPPFKSSPAATEFILVIFEYLFALPTPRMRHVPKCKSQSSRSAAYDLLVELVKGAAFNYLMLHKKLMSQHKPGPNSPFPWDYWPRDEGRSEVGYVGLTNLGATCYMASCVQHLYMMPQARAAVLATQQKPQKHATTLAELQRMFAYLMESERKAYNPRSFCRVYQMDHQPLNTGEQKDMAEFFIDLVSKMEEMTPELKVLVKRLFCGVLSNNVVSLDCDHVSRTLEEFYTVRCQVADMRNLHESLDEVTVKDTLEGDNMYTCSTCGKKVRAEKRACFKKLPHILCFNTMRYTFNMLTMLKEKVNTHFSFPLRLDMSGYVEKQLMPQHYQEEKRKSELRKSESKQGEGDKDNEENQTDDSEDFNEHYEYDLVGVTVHTGTADGGHYYSFIRERGTPGSNRWLLFNDAEVKPFDPSQIAAECFGGEMTSKTYDSVTDKYLDFSFEKTNSAYMLFYEWRPQGGGVGQRGESEGVLEVTENTAQASGTIKTDTVTVPPAVTSPPAVDSPTSVVSVPSTPPPNLSTELEEWIWQDNRHYLQDRNIFEHTYFNFMWQICGNVPQTLITQRSDITCLATQLSTSFFIETFIHAKEKPTMVQWVELLTKQFNGSPAACEWFLDQMCSEPWWPLQVLIQCPNQMVRQMFQRLCIHVIQRLRQSHYQLYLKGEDGSDCSDPSEESLGSSSCVTRFIRSLISLMEHGAKAYLRNLSDYFGLLLEFSRMGEEEAAFLLQIGVIHSVVDFYLGHKSSPDCSEAGPGSDSEDQASSDKPRPASLDKMVALVASLVEKSRGPDLRLQLSSRDFNAIAGGKSFPFLYQQIRDGLNPQQTRLLVHALCRFNERLAAQIIAMVFHAITKHTELCGPFFKLLTLLTDTSGGPSGLPCFSQLVLQRVWDAAEFCPHSALEWLAIQVPRNKIVHSWVLQSADCWVEHFLIGHNNQRVRSAAAFLLVSLIPFPPFRQGYRNPRGPPTSRELPQEAIAVLHQVFGFLLRLLRTAKHYTEVSSNGTLKLTAYFALMTYCMVSKTEKLMVGPHVNYLWLLFHPRLSEPSVAAHHNKQALLVFWHQATVDCPENALAIAQSSEITRNIAFNYILADHEDQDVVVFNRSMLPAYYGLLRLACQQSRALTRQLASHQNLQWAFKNITPHPTQYSVAVDELFRLMQLFATRHEDATEAEAREVTTFRRTTLGGYLQGLDSRVSWATLIAALRILVDCDEDRLYVVYNGGLSLVFDALHTLHVMYHEATACHVSGDLVELLGEALTLVRCLRNHREPRDSRTVLLTCKNWPETVRRLATLLNTYNPPEMRSLTIELLQELLLLLPTETLAILTPLMSHCHAAFHTTPGGNGIPMGPYYPRKGSPAPPTQTKSAPRPPRPMLQMSVPHSQIQVSKGTDPDYDRALLTFYKPYHEFVDMLVRLAVNMDLVSEQLISLSVMVGYEGAPLHLTLFPKLWLDFLGNNLDSKYGKMLLECAYLVEYVDCVLLDERISLTNSTIWTFMDLFFPKISHRVLTPQTCRLVDNMCTSLAENVIRMDLNSGALRHRGYILALKMVIRVKGGIKPPAGLKAALKCLLERVSNELVDNDETPTKKMKLSNDEEEESPTRNTSESTQLLKTEEKNLSCDASTSETQSSPARTLQENAKQLKLLETNILEVLEQIDKITISLSPTSTATTSSSIVE